MGKFLKFRVKRSRFLGLLAVLSVVALRSQSQDFMMQGWYWDYPKTTAGANWADTLRLKAPNLGKAGFTSMWLPPLARTSSGNASNGYDPRDLYDYGEFTGNPTGFGSRVNLDKCIEGLTSAGIKAVADLVYNHRDGGKAENNPGLKNYIANFDWNKANNNANPFPYDRMRCIIPLGGTSGNGAGHYYFKFSSASQHSKFHNFEYKVYMQTNRVGWQNLAAETESEPNGGGDCSQANNNIHLGRDMNAAIDASGCTIDEFHLDLTSSDFNSGGDTLYIYLGKRNSNYSDMRIFGIWSASKSSNIIDELIYQTYTDFSNLPSGKGTMNWSNFKPNNDHTTSLEGDWDGMYFFYDYDQFQNDTKTKLMDWTRWNWSNVGIRGLRMDAVKHFSPEFVGDLLDNLYDNGMNPPLVVGEWYSTNTTELAGWVNSVLNSMNPATKAAIQPRIFDFSLREALRNACDTYGYDARNIFTSSLADATSLSGYNVVTFVNNHDFRDASGFASLIQNNAELAYSYIFTNNKTGLPCVFYPDYFGYPNNGTTYFPSNRNGLMNSINLLMNIHKNYIYGSSSVTYLNKSGSGFSNDAGSNNSFILTYQLTGGVAGKDVVVAINFGSSRVQFHQQLNNLAVGTKLTDITGVTPYLEAVVNSAENGISNDIWVDLPARSYAIWIQGAATTLAPLPATNLTVSYPTPGTILLKWKDNSSNETGFRIERKTCTGAWSSLSTVGANVTSFSDTPTSETELYEYRVVAVNGSLEASSGFTVEAALLPTWTGKVNTSWNTAENWCSGRMPTLSTHAVISTCGAAFQPVINSGLQECNNLTILNGAQLQVNPLNSLTVHGTLTNQSSENGLVIKSDATGTGSVIANTSTTTASAQRYMTTGAWHMVSSPLPNQTVANFLATNTSIPANGSSQRGMMDYNSADNTWNSFFTNTTSGSLTTGKGFATRVAADGNVTFKGNITTVSQDIAVSRGKWNLVGNPYTSAIGITNLSDATSTFIAGNITNLDPSYAAIYVWEKPDANNGQSGNYTIVGNAAPPFNDVQMGQAFFVKAAPEADIVSFTPTMRLHKSSLTLKSSSINWPQIVITATTNATSASAKILFDDTMTRGLDPTYDAGIFKDGDNEIYTRLVQDNGVDFAIQCLPIKGIENAVIPLGYDSKAGGEITFTAKNLNLPPTLSVILEDRANGVKTPLSGSAGSYKTSVQAGSKGTGRFFIYLSNTATANNPLTDNTDINAWVERNNIVVSGIMDQKSSATLFDATGRAVLIQQLTPAPANRIATTGLKTGIYILKITHSGSVQGFKLRLMEE